MKAMKKLIAILLCLAMIPCTFLTVFAAGEVNEVGQAGSVITSRTFDGTVVPDGEKYLVPGGSGNSWAKYNMVSVEDMGNCSSYSVQITFRWKNGASGTNDAIYFGTYHADWSIRYGGRVDSFDQVANNVGPTASSASAWTVPSGSTYGPWVTATLFMEENSPVKMVISVEGAENTAETVNYTATAEMDVTKYAKSDVKTDKGTAGMAIYTGGRRQNFQVKNWCVASLDNNLNTDEIISSRTFGIDGSISGGLPYISNNTGLSFTRTNTDDNSDWHKLEIIDETDTAMLATSSYSIQTTWRWTKGATGNDGVTFGAYACDYTLKYGGHVYNFGENNATYNSTSDLAKHLNSLWKVPDGADYSPWITATLVIKDNAPQAYIIQIEGKQTEIVEYKGNIEDVKTQNKQTGDTVATDKGIHTGGNLSNFEIYDFRVIDGAVAEKTDNGVVINNPALVSLRTPANTDVLEMIGTQEHLDDDAIRFIAELKNTDVDGVTFEITASRTKNGVVEQGKTKIMEPVTVGYKYVTATVNGVPEKHTAPDGSLYVLFVIRDIDLESFDSYTFTICGTAGGSYSNRISYTVGN